MFNLGKLLPLIIVLFAGLILIISGIFVRGVGIIGVGIILSFGSMIGLRMYVNGDL